MVLHVLFTKEGIPAWIGTEPLEGCETVEGLTVEYLAAHRDGFAGHQLHLAAHLRLGMMPHSPE